MDHWEHPTTPQEKQKKLKLILGLLIGLVVAWFVVEVFLPAPFPNLAY